MKKIALLASFAAAAVFGQPAGDFFPLQVGNQWVYHASGRTATMEPVTASIVRTSEFGGKTYFLYAGPQGNSWIRAGQDGALYLYDTAANAEKVVIAPDGVVTPFTNECNQIGRVTSTNADYKGPLGAFGGVIEVRYGPGTCRDAGIERELYLPYVGLIQRTVTTIAGPLTYDLVYARIGGVTVVTAPETSFTVALDASEYEVLSTARVRIALRHTGPAPLKLEFTSGQIFDVVVRNEAGERVYVWSADKVFIQLVQTIEVNGERNWTALVPLVNLPPGKYTAEAFLTNSGPRRYSGTVSFSIVGPEPAKP